MTEDICTAETQVMVCSCLDCSLDKSAQIKKKKKKNLKPVSILSEQQFFGER